MEAYTKRLFVYLSRFVRLEREDGVLFRNKQMKLEVYKKSKKLVRPIWSKSFRGRFYTTCSEYPKRAVQKHGLIKVL